MSMIGNQSLFLNNRDDDALTVQVSDAKSHLGHLLLEADWSEASAHLATPEGRRDVDVRNDPLGLTSPMPNTKEKSKLPGGKDTAFFAALFARAPYELIDQIFAMAPSHVDHPGDLMYVLSIVPSEEAARAREVARRVPHRTRAWTPEEYDRILDLLLRSFASSGSPPSALRGHLPPWTVGGASRPSLTPLGAAAYNPDVPANIVRRICALEPGAAERECKLAGRPTIPLVLAAASPLPPETSSEYVKSKSRRWEKVTLLTLSKARWEEQCRETKNNEIEVASEALASAQTQPTLHEVCAACDAAIKRNEWELVREYLKQYHQNETKNNKESLLEPYFARLAQRDEEVRYNTERRRQSREKVRARDEWLRRNLGPIKYHVDTLLDLVGAAVPKKKSNYEAGSGLVGPMS